MNLNGESPDKLLVERMTAALRHRGPDDEGYYINGVAALGQRRLSIIDLGGGRQPMCNEDGTVWVSFNGEIYNFQELRKTLEDLGHRFATRSDTEVVVHAFEQYGEDCVQKLRGMFAFAVWDEKSKTLLLARDRVGKKPLFYSKFDGCLAFASELQAILAHPRAPREAHAAAIDQYLTYGYIPAPRTGFRGIAKLPPASTLRFQMRGSEFVDLGVHRYWELQRSPKLELNEKEAAERLLEVLTEAVRLRMIADVPLGAMLSGGIDSSMVVALMSGISGRQVKTFSIGFDEQEFNELPHARRVAQAYGTDHHEMIVHPNAVEVLPKLVRHYGEPYADSSAVPTYYVAKLIREHVKVALNGDGGDENLAGYERYLARQVATRYARLPAWVRKGVIEQFAGLIPKSLPQRNRLRQFRRFVEGASQPAAQCYLGWVTYVNPDLKAQMYTAELKAELCSQDARQWLLDLFECASMKNADSLDAVLDVDIGSYLPYDLLVKMDIATMANSLEARSPFLDHKVMEFCARLPNDYKIKNATQKYLLKKAGEKLLPPENMKRRKMGFGAPVAKWLRGDLRELLQDVLLSNKALARGYFQPQAVTRMIQEHLNEEADRSHSLWALLCLEMWNREFIDQVSRDQ